MSTIRPIHDKVLAKMIDGFGNRKTAGGIIIQEADGTEKAIRPRWFEILFTGPEQADVQPGEYVLMAHGRWSRGIDYEGDKEKVQAITSRRFNGVVEEDNHLLEYAREDYEHNKTIRTLLKH